MAKKRTARIPRLNPGDPLLIQSLGKRSAEPSLRGLSAEQVAQVRRTVRRAPEVIVKVSGGGPDAGSVGAHLKYISRRGSLPLEFDSGESLSGSGVAGTVTADWSLDALPTVARPRGRRAEPATGRSVRVRPKAVHNIVLSMPAKVPPEKVLAAARTFGRENFALMHRYAMVLHTDTRHPHVHMVVKAEREDGSGRLNIYKATLRQWREQFAQALREQGIEANATPAALRGRSEHRLKTPIDRAQRRSSAGSTGPGGSTFLRRKALDVLERLSQGDMSVLHEGQPALMRTRTVVEQRWAEAARQLEEQSEPVLAAEVRAFAATLPKVRTDAQRIAAAAVRLSRARERPQDSPDGQQPARAIR